jgi:hypothetical protein
MHRLEKIGIGIFNPAKRGRERFPARTVSDAVWWLRAGAVFIQGARILANHALSGDLEWDILVPHVPVDAGHRSSLTLGGLEL